jgi:hypothetical protein
MHALKMVLESVSEQLMGIAKSQGATIDTIFGAHDVARGICMSYVPLVCVVVGISMVATGVHAGRLANQHLREL